MGQGFWGCASCLWGRQVLGGGRHGCDPCGSHRPAAGTAASVGRGKPGLYFTVRQWPRLRVPSLETTPRAQATSHPTSLGFSLPAPSLHLPPGPPTPRPTGQPLGTRSILCSQPCSCPAPALPGARSRRRGYAEGASLVCFIRRFSVRPFPRIYNCTDWGGGSLTGVISHHASIVGNGNFLDRAIRVCVCGNVKNCV